MATTPKSRVIFKNDKDFLNQVLKYLEDHQYMVEILEAEVLPRIKDNLLNKRDVYGNMAQWQTVGDLNRTHKEWLDKETQYHGKLH